MGRILVILNHTPTEEQEEELAKHGYRIVYKRHPHIPAEADMDEVEEEAIKIIDGKKRDRRWWVRNIGFKPMRSLLASTIFYLARREGKHIPQRVVAERYKVTEETIRNHRGAVSKLLEG